MSPPYDHLYLRSALDSPGRLLLDVAPSEAERVCCIFLLKYHTVQKDTAATVVVLARWA